MWVWNVVLWLGVGLRQISCLLWGLTGLVHGTGEREESVKKSAVYNTAFVCFILQGLVGHGFTFTGPCPPQ